MTRAEVTRAAATRAVMKRADLAASITAFRDANRTPAMWLPLAGALGGFTLAAVLITVAGARQWPEWTQPALFVAGWAVTLACFAVVFRRTRALVERCQWRCPACGTPLIATRGMNPLARAEIALASGRCPGCGVALLDG